MPRRAERDVEYGERVHVDTGRRLFLNEQRPVAVPGAHHPRHGRAAGARIGVPLIGQTPAQVAMVLREAGIEPRRELIPAGVPLAAARGPRPRYLGPFAASEIRDVTGADLET